MEGLGTPESKRGALSFGLLVAIVLLSLLYLPAIVASDTSDAGEIERVYTVDPVGSNLSSISVHRPLPQGGNSTEVVRSSRSATQQRLAQIEQDTGRSIAIDPPGTEERVGTENLTDRRLNVSMGAAEDPPDSRFVVEPDKVRAEPELSPAIMLFRELGTPVPSGKLATYGVGLNLSGRAVLSDFDLSSQEAIIVTSSHGRDAYVRSGLTGSNSNALASAPFPDIAGRRAIVVVEGAYYWTEYHAWLGPSNFARNRPIMVSSKSEIVSQLRLLPHRLLTAYGLFALVASVVLGQAALRGWRRLRAVHNPPE